MTTSSTSSNDSSWGGTRQGNRRQRKRLRYSVLQKNSGRPPTLAGSDEKNAERLVGDEELALVKAPTGQFVTRDRCWEVLRAIRSVMNEMFLDNDTGGMQTSKIASSVMAKCTCGSDIVRAGLKALLSLDVDTIQDFILNSVTKRSADRRHLRKLSPQMVG